MTTHRSSRSLWANRTQLRLHPRPVYPILFCRILQLRVRRLQLACHQQAHFQNPENPKQQLYADHSAHAFMTKAISCGRSTLRGLSIFFIQDGLA